MSCCSSMMGSAAILLTMSLVICFIVYGPHVDSAEDGAHVNISSGSITKNMNIKQDQDWYDCSSEVNIPLEDQLVYFSDVRSEPAIVTPESTQTIYKTIHYNNNQDTPSAEAPRILRKITVDFHQYYKVCGRYWMTFLVVHGVNECQEHSNLCPIHPGEQKNLVTVHPKLNPLTPYGWYRSRQIYKDLETGQKIGCVDMSFQYAAALSKQQEEEDSWMLRGSAQS